MSRPVLVDVTAEETSDLLLSAVRQGFDLVLANKKPLAGSAASHAALSTRRGSRAAGSSSKPRWAPGLPILDTYKKLVESGDQVLRIEGCVSGTLGYVLSAVSRGAAVLGGGARGRGARLRRARPA